MIIAKIIFVILIILYLINIPFTIYHTNKLMSILIDKRERKKGRK